MPSTKRKLQILGGVTLLLLLAATAGCTGFFQNPVLTGLTVGPQSPNIQQGTTLQLSATGTFDDGSTKTLTSKVFWSSSDVMVVPISSGGVITGASSGTATITASSGAASGTTSVTVTLMNVTGITIMPSSLTVPRGQTGMLTVLANAGGTQVDVTATVTWTITDSSGMTAQNISITTQTSPATIMVNSNALTGNYTVTATYAGTTTLMKSITLTVT
jgi:uncharacterized cupredoxin-like copper-binding protein